MAGRAPAGQAFPSVEEIKANPVVGRKGEKLLTQLALDLSSSCVGWAVGANGKLGPKGKFVFKSTAGTGEKLVCFEAFLRTLIQTFFPSVLIIERPLSRRANTTGRHFELLGIVKKLWSEMTGQELDEASIISPITIKRIMGVKAGRDHDHNKEIMVNRVNSLYGLGLRFDKGSKLKTDDDTADAIAALHTYWRLHGSKT